MGFNSGFKGLMDEGKQITDIENSNTFQKSCSKLTFAQSVTFELWTWRRILRVPWTEKRRNFSVLEDVKPKRLFQATIFRLKLRYFGDVMRAKRSLERDIILGKVEGHRKQGKPRMRWLDSIKQATGLRLEDLKEAVQDRKKWRTVVEEKTRNRVRTNVK